MTPETLARHFDLLTDAPNAAKKLRELVLQLAVQGKLVEQDPNDEPAGVLLKRIEADKKRLIKEKAISKLKPLPPINDDELPSELPFGWHWTQLETITQKLGAGSTPRGGKSVYLDEGVIFLRSQNIWNTGLKLDDVALISEEIHRKMSGTFVESGDILLNITGASIGRSALVPDNFVEGNVSQHVAIVRLVDKATRQYIHLCVISPFFQNTIRQVRQ